jgi:arylsulfatase A-like enzyme/Flp pilus assembly protein TadD
MARGHLLAALLLAAALAACGRPDLASDPGSFPSAPLVLISIDTLRSDHLPAYGYDKVQTPHIDALRRDAVLFRRAYSHCPLTLPSHVSLLTGLLPFEHGVEDNLGYTFDASRHASLPSLLKAKNYATGAAVSAYVLRGATGLGAAFDFYEDRIPPPVDSDAASQVRRAGPETARLALGWLDTVSRGPFFLFLHLYEPHSPYEPPEPFRSRYASAYDGSIAAADAVVGETLNHLEARGLYDRSLVILLSDHGEGLGEHGEDFHGILLYREALQVPLLVKLPGGARRGTTVERPVGLVDVLPTLTRLLALDQPEGLSGKSLFEPSGSPTSTYAETYYPRIHLGWSELHSVLDDRFHLIEGPAPELYDLARDSGETVNLVEERASVARAMRGVLSDIQSTFVAPSKVDAEDMERLRALGYLGGSRAALPSGPLPDPKARIHILDDVKAAFRLTSEGKDAAAVAAFRTLLAANPGLFDVEYELGRALSRLGRWDEAALVFERALADAPTFAGPIDLALARVEVARGRWKEAGEAARRIVDLNPGQAHEILARVALARGDLGVAEGEALLAKGDTLAELNAVIIRSEIRIRRSLLSEALALLDEARRRIGREKLPPLRDLQFLRGDVLARQGRIDDARQAFEEEIRSFPTNSAAYARLAVVYGLQGRHVSDVRELLDRMVHARPGREAMNLAAQTLDTLGDRAGAAEWRRRAR